MNTAPLPSNKLTNKNTYYENHKTIYLHIPYGH